MRHLSKKGSCSAAIGDVEARHAELSGAVTKFFRGDAVRTWMRRWRWQPPPPDLRRGPGGHLIEDGGRWRHAGYAFVDAFGLLAGAGETRAS